MADFKNTEDVFDSLTKTVGRLCADLTGRQVVLDDEKTIPKKLGEFIMVSQTSADQLDWASDEVQDASGNAMVCHNYEVIYTLTAFRGNAFSALTKVLQGLNLPYVYNKYFPTPSAFAYSSASTVTRLRVPLNMSEFENRALVLITFNVVFMASDTTAFESVENINMQVVYHFDDPTN